MFESLLVDATLIATSYAVDGIPFKMAAKRYKTPGASANGVTLIFTHASGAHKEHWEPIIRVLLVPNGAASDVKLPGIREVWSLDALDHGDSAIANHAVLQTLKDGVSIVEWGKAIQSFVESELTSHKIVFVGHSMGSVAGVLSMMYSPVEKPIPYAAMVIVEPPMHDRKVLEDNYKERTTHNKVVLKAVLGQRSQFESREAAYAWLSTHSPWKAWDERVRKLYVNYGFRLLDENNTKGPVGTKCHKLHEAGKYPEWEPMFTTVEYITKTCSHFPYHFVYGAITDIMPRYVQDNAVDPERGRKVASVTRVKGAGHMVIQQKPELFAGALRNILSAALGDSLRDESHL
ncbi:hypothetical protein BDW22DRAFT_321847 [Trametopsis cervina]|nr:hypothetical protein BDW22DRAFT_321847 [Trametopsis cervina]